MRLSHARAAITAHFDDPNLVSCAGLAPVMALAERCGLRALLDDRLRIAKTAGANATTKVLALVAGMLAGADSITDMDLLRHGGMRRLFEDVRAPTTLGMFLRCFTFGHIRALDGIASRLLARLAQAAPLLPGADQLTFLDLDDTVRATYGYAKQGAGRGYSGVNGLNALLATLSTVGSAPVIAGARLRRGATNSVRGVTKLLADALATAKRCGATGTLLVRTDSAFYTADVVATCRRAGARFSITARHTRSIRAAIAGIDDGAWTPIRYPQAVWDDDAGCWVSDAEVAEIDYTAFTGRRRSQRVTARLLVRRVRRLNPDTAPAGEAAQGELFAAYRYHCVFTNSTMPMLEAEAAHRDHAVVEQVICDLKDSALAHLPSGDFDANGAWLACAMLAHNLTRAAGTLARLMHAKARTGTLRARLIAVPARLARSAGRLVLHLPSGWPWEPGFDQLFRQAMHDPLPTAA